MFQKIKENTVASYKRTMTRINITKLIINGCFQLFFLIYYIYLITTHKDSTDYMICYSILLGVLVVSFIIEIILMDKVDDTKEEKKSKKNKKKKTKSVVKIIKYIVKIATIYIAMRDIRLNGGTHMATLLVYWSILVLCMQLTFEIIMFAIRKTFSAATSSLRRREKPVEQIENSEEDNSRKKRR